MMKRLTSATLWDAVTNTDEQYGADTWEGMLYAITRLFHQDSSVYVAEIWKHSVTCSTIVAYAWSTPQGMYLDTVSE